MFCAGPCILVFGITWWPGAVPSSYTCPSPGTGPRRPSCSVAWPSLPHRWSVSWACHSGGAPWQDTDASASVLVPVPLRQLGLKHSHPVLSASRHLWHMDIFLNCTFQNQQKYLFSCTYSSWTTPRVLLWHGWRYFGISWQFTRWLGWGSFFKNHGISPGDLPGSCVFTPV